MLNKYSKRAHISECKIKQFLKLFCEDFTATRDILTMNKILQILKSLFFKIFKRLLILDCWEISKHQRKISTSYNRYPEIFEVTRNYSNSKFPNPRDILSFGCSTGEECFSLREYFPAARIIGTDINKSNLKICNNKNFDKNIKFIYSNSENLLKENPYDLIFCMSVLCRWPDTKNIDDISSIIL